MSSSHDRSTAVPDASVLVVFARYPEPGRIKTRLAPAIGHEAAAALYAAFVSDLARRLAAASFAVRWAVAPPDPGFAARFALPPESVFAQQGADLGARMQNALRSMLEAGFARCAIIGSDMPQLTRAIVEEAFARLDDAELVLGPAEDGGYYLIAASAVPDVFDGIVWGGPDVFAATHTRAGTLGLRTALLEPGFDVDVAQDVERLRALVAGDRAARDAMPATAAALAVLRRARG